MAVVRDELVELKQRFGRKRVTTIVAETDEPEFTEEAFIVEEDAVVILCASGWVKRVRSVKDVHQTRMREGDSVLAAVAGSTRASVAFFSNHGVCYVSRIDAIPAATGYGEPIQKLFKLGDGERIVTALSFDPRVLEVIPAEEGVLEPQPPFALAVTRGGLGCRFSLRNHAEPSTRAGRKFARLNDGDEVLAVMPLGMFREADLVMCASDDGHALAVRADEVPVLSGPGKGVIVMKLEEGAVLLGAELGHRDLDAIVVETGGGSERSLTLRSIEGSRAGRGSAVVKRGGFSKFVWRKVETPNLGGERAESN
jgi:DNA gyrase subunit A